MWVRPSNEQGHVPSQARNATATATSRCPRLWTWSSRAPFPFFLLFFFIYILRCSSGVSGYLQYRSIFPYLAISISLCALPALRLSVLYLCWWYRALPVPSSTSSWDHHHHHHHHRLFFNCFCTVLALGIPAGFSLFSSGPSSWYYNGSWYRV